MSQSKSLSALINAHKASPNSLETASALFKGLIQQPVFTPLSKDEVDGQKTQTCITMDGDISGKSTKLFPVFSSLENAQLVFSRLMVTPDSPTVQCSLLSMLNLCVNSGIPIAVDPTLSDFYIDAKLASVLIFAACVYEPDRLVALEGTMQGVYH